MIHFIYTSINSSADFFKQITPPFLHPFLDLSFLFQKKISFKEMGRERDFRVITDEGVVGRKLNKELDAAQKQKEQETDCKAFKYFPCNRSNLEVHTESLKVGEYSVGVCHAQGRRPTMEDQHIATSLEVSIGGKSYPIQLFGVFDGHGGSEASLFVKKNLEKELKKALLECNPKELSEAGIWNALKKTTVRLSEEFKKIGNGSGTTATISLILDGNLWTANVGDSRTILQNKGKETLQLSEDAKPDDPRYKKSIEKRGGFVYRPHPLGPYRINGNLAVGRAIGDLSVGEGMTARPKITRISLSNIKPGSRLVLACDGIYDVASTRQVGSAVAGDRESASKVSENLVYSAYQAGSGDNLSVLVVDFPGPEQITESAFSWIWNRVFMNS